MITQTLYLLNLFYQILPQSYVCREAIGECDVPEFCDGKSGEVC